MLAEQVNTAIHFLWSYQPFTPSSAINNRMMSMLLAHQLPPLSSRRVFALLLLLVSLFSHNVTSLSVIQSKSPPIQRVAIIGSGIAGLSLAHALTNSPELLAKSSGCEIQVALFDARPSFDFNAGAGVQLNGGELVIRASSNVTPDTTY